MKKDKKGFTLMEIMIVVAIIGILAAIGIPNYLQAGKKAQRNACIANLKLLDGAVQQAKFHYPDVEITMEILTGPDKFIRSEPTCPVGHAEYTVLDPPECPSLPLEHLTPNG
jgi:prepilin-type N-terminal cleavage/methylation domain-containing protein